MSTGQIAYPRVFVSHAHAENVLCDQYVEEQRQHGLDVQYDRTNLEGGRSLSDEIQRQLQSHKVFIVMLSTASMASQWVKLEIDAYRSLAAADPTRLLLPVRVGACDVPLPIRGLLQIDATNQPFESAIAQIVQAVTDPVGVTGQFQAIGEPGAPGAGTSRATGTPPMGGRSGGKRTGAGSRQSQSPVRC